jgi:hypothetical protein
VGDFDCTRPADGTPLLTCCQGAPGNLVACGNLVTKEVLYTATFWLNVNTCQLFKTMVETVRQYNNVTEVVEADRITTYDYKLVPSNGTQLDESATYTAPIALNDFNFMCGNTVGRVTAFNCNQTGETFTVRCFDSAGNVLPSVRWEYEIAYSNPITWQELLGPWNELLNFTSGNFETLTGSRISFDRFGNISQGTTFALPPRCQSGDVRDVDDGAIGGMMRKASITPPVTYWYSQAGPWQDPATSQSKCGFRRVDFIWRAWFSRVDLSQFYQVETVNLQSIPTPTVCPQFSPLLNDNLNCQSVQVLEFSDGLDDIGGARRPIFGPTSYDAHITITRCRS